MIKADLHIHSSCSDGSDDTNELIDKISGLDVFALTDHDTTEGCKAFKEIHGFIPGVELTCLCGDIKCHILGYGIDTDTPELVELIAEGKVLRRQKLETRIKYLKDVWGIVLTPEERDWLYSRKSTVKTHVANILVNRGLADNNLDAMKKYLDGCKTGNTRFDGRKAISALKAAGGVVIWAHPLGGEGEKHLAKDEFLKRLDVMKGFGIEGLECFYSRYNKEEIEFLTECANTNNLLISGGSDYHGSNKDIPLGKLNAEGLPVDGGLLSVIPRLQALR